jgi:tRNA splicing endonuclease
MAISEELKRNLEEMAKLPDGKRYEVYVDLAKRGFLVTINLSSSEDVTLHEVVDIKTKEDLQVP